MKIPAPVYHPSFNITRASHVVMTVKDLAASKHFYTEVVGLIVSDEDSNTVYLRGLEEACHHSLALKRATGKPNASASACASSPKGISTRRQSSIAGGRIAGEMGLGARFRAARCMSRTPRACRSNFARP